MREFTNTKDGVVPDMKKSGHSSNPPRVFGNDPSKPITGPKKETVPAPAVVPSEPPVLT